MAKPRIRIRRNDTWGWSWHCPLCGVQSFYWPTWALVMFWARVHLIQNLHEHVQHPAYAVSDRG